MKILPWNITTGCERLTLGCDNCPTYWEYLEDGRDYHPHAHSGRLREPLNNLEPSVYVVSPGSDLFHEAIRADFIEEVVDVMTLANWHHFEVIAKRAERLESVSNRYLTWPDNVMVGVAVEEAQYNWRIDCLRNVDCRRIVSFGPMTGPIGEVDLTGIEIAGAVVEYWGPQPREVDPAWVEDISRQCEEQGVIVGGEHWLCKETF